MANPQPEPFVKFSKELFDALLLSSMPATHKEIVLAVIRRTYGDRGKKIAPVSQCLLREMTGRSEGGIRKSLAALKEQGVIVEIEKATWTTPAILGLNKDYESWGCWSVRTLTAGTDPQDLPDPYQSGGPECPSSGGPDPQLLPDRTVPGGTPWKTIDLEKGGTRAREDAPPVDNFRDCDFEEDPPGDPRPKKRAPAQQLVAFYVDEHRRALGSAPTKRQIGILADIVGEKLKGGASPDAVQVAIRLMVRKGKGPSTLPAFVDEAEVAARGQPGPGPDPGPPPTKEERAASAQAARATNALVQALARKKAMPT